MTLVDDEEEQNHLFIIRTMKANGFKFFPDSPANRAQAEDEQVP